MASIMSLGELSPLLEEIIEDGVKGFQNALQEKGLVLTDDLRRSFSMKFLPAATQLAGEIEFRGYGRFKDMAKVSYLTHAPPVDAMEEYVEKIGIDQFAYVQGYEGKSVPTVNNAARRIAWALSISRRKVPSVKRGYRGTWYNSSKVDMINKAKKKMARRYAQLVASFMAGELSSEG